jgi:hypothetical protein
MSAENTSELRPARKLFEQLTGTRPSPSTLHRWLHRGVAGGIKLRAVRLGGEWFCSRHDVDAFIAAQTRAAYAACQPADSAQDEKRTAQIDRDLSAAGLL